VGRVPRWSPGTGSRWRKIAEGTRVTYDADLALKGLLRIVDPVLALAFNRVGDRWLPWLIDGGFEEQKAERLAASLADTVVHRTVT
jgi:hypothetical protein